LPKELNIQMAQPKKDYRYDYDGDEDVGKNQPHHEKAVTAIGTSAHRMAHPIPTLRAKLLL
jgi:hypothetical protein